MEGVERAGIEADHSHMCKFDDDNAAGYEVVAEARIASATTSYPAALSSSNLHMWLWSASIPARSTPRQAPAVITERWAEEKKARTQEKKAKAREIYDGESSNLHMWLWSASIPARSTPSMYGAAECSSTITSRLRSLSKLCGPTTKHCSTSTVSSLI
jgi:hypothetical protein